ncbi:hypothetical protein GCM10023197_27440 [Gordonia humi]
MEAVKFATHKSSKGSGSAQWEGKGRRRRSNETVRQNNIKLDDDEVTIASEHTTFL